MLTHSCTHTPAHTHTHIHSYTHTHAHTCTCTHIHTHTRSYMYTHTHKHAHTHTYSKESSFLGEKVCSYTRPCICYRSAKFQPLPPPLHPHTHPQWQRGLPIEVLPFAYRPVSLRLEGMGGSAELRMAKSKAVSPPHPEPGRLLNTY